MWLLAWGSKREEQEGLSICIAPEEHEWKIQRGGTCEDD